MYLNNNLMDMIMSTMTGGSQDDSTGALCGSAVGGYVVAVPYPARGHVNPMINFCSALTSKGISVILVVTEEWLELIGGEARVGCRVATIPNCIPSEKDRNEDMMAFFAAVGTYMKPALDSVIDGLEVTVSCIVADANIKYMTGFGGRPNIPFVTLWTTAPSMFFAYYHFDAIIAANTQEEKDTKVRIGSIPFEFPVKSVAISFANLKSGDVNKALQFIAQTATTTNALLISSNEEFEPEIINALRASLPIPLYTIGPCIPYSSLKLKPSGEQEPIPSYIHWLDACPKDSVLYISLGSYEKLPDEELEEISKGLKASQVRYIWSVKVEDTSDLKEDCEERGLIVPWCDQLRVLCHPSVGGFLTHCGWNSVMDAIFAGVPMLTLPQVLDQVHICNIILNKWGIGLKLKDKNKETVSREEITTCVTRLMNLTENKEIYEVRKQMKKYKNICQKAFQSGGSTDVNISSFIRDFVQKEGN